jgi:transcriptional regulator with XRE-family HTH domain
MGLISRKNFLQRIRRSKEARAKLVANNLSEEIAFQIRATRDAQGLTQADLASEAGMSQNNFSRLESPEYGKHSLSSLKRVAEALDVALVVRFVPFSQYIDWLTGTPFLDYGSRPESLAVSSFDKEEKERAFDFQRQHWTSTSAARIQNQPRDATGSLQRGTIEKSLVRGFPPIASREQRLNTKGEAA